MTKLRNVNTPPDEFRRKLKEITFYLGYEATRGLNLTSTTIQTPMGEFEGSKITDNVAIIPVLRAGLSMADGMLELLPNAAVHHIGMYRAKESLLPIQYYNRLPKGTTCDVAYIVDPCIATANTINAVVSILKRWGAKKIVVIAAVGSRTGVNRLLELHPQVDVIIGAIDENISEDGMILPGIGDAGDRQFGTQDEIPDFLPQPPLSPTNGKRKREEAAAANASSTDAKK